MRTRQEIEKHTLPELAWQKTLPMEVFTEKEADGWRCEYVYSNIGLYKDIANSMREFRFKVTETEVKPYLPECKELSELALVAETAIKMQGWANHLQSHLNNNK